MVGGAQSVWWIEVEGTDDEGEMRKRLREIAELASLRRVIFFRKQTYIIAKG